MFDVTWWFRWLRGGTLDAMLTSLVMTNVRRHARTELDFGADEQLVLLDGANGAGKTTVLEAIQWALFGYTRHGRAGLSAMVRRGAEHEGMGVELAFTCGGVAYRVVRRWEKGKSSAMLYADGVPVQRSVAAVNAEVASVLGTDARGFALSSVATQTDRAELTALSPAARRAAITRLFRFDAFASAKVAARGRYAAAAERAKAVAEAAETHNADEHAGKVAAAAAARAALAEAQASVAALDAKVADAASAQAEFAAASAAAAAAAATAAASERAAAAAVNLLAVQEASPVRVPDDPGVSVQEASAAVAELTGRLAAARAAANTRTLLESALRLLAAARDRQVRAQAEVDKFGDGPALAVRVASAADELEEALAAAETAADVLSAAQVEAARCGQSAADAGAAAEASNGLESVCDRCGQHVDAEHAALQRARTAAAAAAAADAAAAAVRVRSDAAAAAAVATRRVEAARVAVSEAAAAAAAGERAAADVAAAAADVADHVGSVSRLEGALAEAEDVGQVLSALKAASAVQEGARLFADAVRRRDEQEREVARLRAAADAAGAAAVADAAAAAAAVVDPVLAAKAEEAHMLGVRRSEEQAFVAELAAAAATADAQVEASLGQAERAASAAAAVSQYRVEARVASKAAAVLDRAASLAAANARPRLQAKVEDLLTVMSGGRFSQVEVSEDYQVAVRDTDGVLMDMSEYSGGEQDLIALAVRLALAQQVSGHSQVGFIILDEVFGSQDADRCASIVAALRALRETYGQIFIISHVGGLAEGADRVVKVRWDVEEAVSEAA